MGRSHEELAADTGLSVHQVKRGLQGLRERDLIVTRKNINLGVGQKTYTRLTKRAEVLLFPSNSTDENGSLEQGNNAPTNSAEVPRAIEHTCDSALSKGKAKKANKACTPSEMPVETTGGDVKASEVTAANEAKTPENITELAKSAKKKSEFGKVWVVALKQSHPELPMVSPLTNAQLAQLFGVVKAAKEHGPYPGQLIRGVVERWSEFTRYVSKKTGLPTKPELPRVGYVLQHKDLAIAWWLGVQVEMQASAPSSDSAWGQLDG